MKKVLTAIFGERAQGEPVGQPKLRTVYPPQQVSENEWAIVVKFGSRYGTKGSFYDHKNKFAQTVAFQIK